MVVAEYPVTAPSRPTERLTNRPTFSLVLEREIAPVAMPQLVIEFVHEEGEFLALEPITGMFGEGATEMDAFADLLASLREMQNVLASDEPMLSRELVNYLTFLRSV